MEQEAVTADIKPGRAFRKKLEAATAKISEAANEFSVQARAPRHMTVPSVINSIMNIAHS